MDEISSDYQSPFGKLTPYYRSVYYGAGILLLGIIILAASESVVGVFLILAGIVVLIIALIYFYIFLYRLWKFIISASVSAGLKPLINTPAEAIGFMFIPVFNFYWIFKAIGGLPKEIIKIAGVKNVQTNIPEQLGIIICVLVFLSLIPYLGILISAILLLVLHPMFLKDCVADCERINAAGDFRLATTQYEATSKILWESENDYSKLFNQKEYGINYYIGMAFFVGLIISRSFHFFWINSLYDYYYLPEFDFFLIGVGVDLVAAFLFVLVSHIVKQNWFIPFAWGAAYIIISIFHTSMIQGAIEPASGFTINIHIIEPMKIIYDFIYGVIYLLGIIFVVYMWGAKIWSLMIGFVASYLVYKIMRLGINFIGSPLEFRSESIFNGFDLIILFARLIMASLIYLGFYLHFEKVSGSQITAIDTGG